jgi:hypothetical protein
MRAEPLVVMATAVQRRDVAGARQGDGETGQVT